MSGMRFLAASRPAVAHRRSAALVAGLVVAGLLLAACSSAAATPGAKAGDVPAVAHASDLSVAPVVAKDAAAPPTKLVVRDLVVGHGTLATKSSTVQVNYVGVDYRTGVVFNSTWSTNQPATFPLSETIPGFGEGIAGMRVGGRREIVIPPVLAYGAAGRPPVIGKNETLVFVVDLLDVQG